MGSRFSPSWQHRRNRCTFRCFVVTQGRGLPRPCAGRNCKTLNNRRPRNTSVGVDAHIDPAGCNHKIAHAIGDPVQCFVGADDPVRPLGNGNFAATYRKNGRASCGSMWASTPTNGMRVRIGAFMFAGAYRRADRGVRPYGCIPFRIGASKSTTFYRAGGACPASTLRRNPKQRTKDREVALPVFLLYFSSSFIAASRFLIIACASGIEPARVA